MQTSLRRSIRRTVVRPALLMALPLIVAACGDDGTEPEPTNRRPNASINPSQTSTPAGDNFMTIITLDGSGSSDADGDALTFAWTVPGGQFENGTSASDESIDVSFPGIMPYDVQLIVRDTQGAADTATVTIDVVAPANNRPVAVAVATPDSVPMNDNNMTIVELDGSGSSDPDGDALTYNWTPQSGTFELGTSASDQIASVSFPGNAPYNVRLIVSDGALDDTTNITVDVF
ncbi:MAG: PKD domain-containing protein [Gemmatimonadota bacterium]